MASARGRGSGRPITPDALPPVVNVGLGSPTGVKFGTTSAFPEPYRRALFALDWTFGRILAVHLEPRGASATGRFETFLQGRPLNLTAIEFGRDGALYFITGGRKTRSALYRVRYTGGEEKGADGGAVVATSRRDAPGIAARKNRRGGDPQSRGRPSVATIVSCATPRESRSSRSPSPGGVPGRYRRRNRARR